MLGPAIHERLNVKDFQPFTLILANGECIAVRHPDSVALASIEFRGRRSYASMLTVLETRDENVIEHCISLQLVAQVVVEHGLGGTR